MVANVIGLPSRLGKHARNTRSPAPRYHYLRAWLAQDWLCLCGNGERIPASLSASMPMSRRFSAQLEHLLVQLAREGFGVTTCAAGLGALPRALLRLERERLASPNDLTRRWATYHHLLDRRLS